MDPFELLKNDHRKVSALFQEIEGASRPNKKVVFSQLKNELDLHAQIEETIFYPALERTAEAHEITLEAYEEHKVVKDLLAELASSGIADEEWDAKLTVLKENVEHHVEEEEGEMFDKAEAALSDEQLDGLGSEMAAAKAEAQGSAATQTQVDATKRRAGAKSRSSSKPGPKKAGVLTRLANFIGMGETSSKRTSRKASSRSSTRKSASKTTKKAAAKKAGKKSTKKVAAKKASKKRGTTKASIRKASVTSRTSAQKVSSRRGSTKSRKSSARKSSSKRGK